jgi:hypothetical protein
VYINGQWRSPLSFRFFNFLSLFLLTFRNRLTIIILKERTVVPNGGFIKWQMKIN